MLGRVKQDTVGFPGNKLPAQKNLMTLKGRCVIISSFLKPALFQSECSTTVNTVPLSCQLLVSGDFHFPELRGYSSHASLSNTILTSLASSTSKCF